MSFKTLIKTPLLLSAYGLISCSGTEVTQEQIDQCKQLIYQSNGYEPNRMTYVGTEAGAIIISYKRTTANKEWKLRCINGSAQVWAPGAGNWMNI